MSAAIGKAYVQILPSTAGFHKKLENKLQSPMDEVGSSSGKGFVSSFTNAFNAFKSSSTFAALKVGFEATVKALQFSGALQQSLGGVETLFKDSANKVVANADKAFQTTGLSANKYMENVTSFSASLLASLGGDTDKAADAADQALRDMSDNANKFGTSMESITNAYQGFAKQNYFMLDNLKLGGHNRFSSV